MSKINLLFIKTRRRELGLSQGNVANALGYSGPSPYSKIESGDAMLKADMLPELAQVLNVTILDLFTKDSSKTEHETEEVS